MRLDLTPSSKLNEGTPVRVRVIPLVALPKMSFEARRNWTRVSACSGLKTSGSFVRSRFFIRKSWLRIRIWLWICAFEMFWRSLLYTTCTTVWIVRVTGAAAAKPRACTASVRFSISDRARR